MLGYGGRWSFTRDQERGKLSIPKEEQVGKEGEQAEKKPAEGLKGGNFASENKNGDEDAGFR